MTQITSDIGPIVVEVLALAGIDPTSTDYDSQFNLCVGAVAKTVPVGLDPRAKAVIYGNMRRFMRNRTEDDHQYLERWLVGGSPL
jgi:hypothetical protein